MSAESFGMMSEAYFVGRQQLVDWVNELLVLNIKKVEECASGAVYCQIVDCVVGPGKVAMKKVDYDCHYEHEFLKNYKVLQDSFEKIGLDKVIPIDRLVKARHQDNLEFLQWMYQWYQRTMGTADAVEYNAVKRRALGKGGKTWKAARPASGAAAGRKPTRKPAAASKPQVSKVASSGYGASRPKPARTEATKPRPTKPAPSAGASKRPGSRKASGRQVDEQDKAELKELLRQKSEAEKQIEELTNVAKDLEKERDFYFNKILEVETTIKSQNQETTPLIQKILDILYSTDDDGDGEEAGQQSSITEKETEPSNEETPAPEAQNLTKESEEDAKAANATPAEPSPEPSEPKPSDPIKEPDSDRILDDSLLNDEDLLNDDDLLNEDDLALGDDDDLLF